MQNKISEFVCKSLTLLHTHSTVHLELNSVVAHLETIPWNHKNVFSVYDYA